MTEEAKLIAELRGFADAHRVGSIRIDMDDVRTILAAIATRPSPARDEGAGTMGRGGEADLGRFILQEHELTGLHPRTAKLVRTFAFALAGKLRKAEQKYGYSDGWSRGDWEAECRTHLHEHVAKGDPLDVAAYSAFCWSHGWSTAAPVSAPGMEREEDHLTSHPQPCGDASALPADTLRSENERLRLLVGEAEIQITYLHEKFGETGSGNAVLARLRGALGLLERPAGQEVAAPADGSQVEPSTTGAGRHIPLEPNPFIQWNGGENPAPGKVVDVKHRNGKISDDCQSGDFSWAHPWSAQGDAGDDIIAYRIIPTDGEG